MDISATVSLSTSLSLSLSFSLSLTPPTLLLIPPLEHSSPNASSLFFVAFGIPATPQRFRWLPLTRLLLRKSNTVLPASLPASLLRGLREREMASLFCLQFRCLIFMEWSETQPMCKRVCIHEAKISLNTRTMKGNISCLFQQFQCSALFFFSSRHLCMNRRK